jgi:L-threonylcarbamoyladenylate synthase
MKITKNIGDAATLLAQPGSVGILPTDTIYGLAARAVDKSAVARLYALKNREQKPGTVIAASIEQLVSLGIPRRYLVPVSLYWPNPISVVVPTAPGLQYLDLGKFSLAVRIPANSELQILLQQTGPLLTSSANHPGEEPATAVSQAQIYFHDQVDFYVDKGQINGQASTVVRVVDDAVEVLREGAVKINENGEIER